ncbi:hypothetical protein LTR56_027227 [Elasticomyces elasticus]|nr:hypothetical protein LTR56_027227 [Elasticomyces elasticus]KAK3616235.1 hypothetical protein LTR22_027137 [Elasticomyces elasticus]KAK4896867.1 hypothetical protein LTR49_028078 [Elasticomyces elasticus]
MAWESSRGISRTPPKVTTEMVKKLERSVFGDRLHCTTYALRVVVTSAIAHHRCTMVTMNPDDKATTSGPERQASHSYASSESESTSTGGSTGRKCASRVGTRKVTTLRASQLERKGTNDREAQRVIRKRIKEYIEILKKTVSSLRGLQESNEKIVAVTQQRNRDPEHEISYLRSKLHEGGYVPEAPMIKQHTDLDFKNMKSRKDDLREKDFPDLDWFGIATQRRGLEPKGGWASQPQTHLLCREDGAVKAYTRTDMGSVFGNADVDTESHAQRIAPGGQKALPALPTRKAKAIKYDLRKNDNDTDAKDDLAFVTTHPDGVPRLLEAHAT